MRISTEPFYKLFSVVHNYFYQCFYSLRGYMMIVSLQNVSENLEKLREKENLKMPISTKPFYKLFSTVHNYFLWMFLIIERIYDDRIPRKCSQKLRKFAKNLKPENANIYWTILQTFQCCSQLLFINVSIHWKDIWSSYPSKMFPKIRKFAKNLKPENANIYQVISHTFQCGSQQLSMNVSNQWKDIWWTYPSKMFPKS